MHAVHFDCKFVFQKKHLCRLLKPGAVAMGDGGRKIFIQPSAGPIRSEITLARLQVHVARTTWRHVSQKISF